MSAKIAIVDDDVSMLGTLKGYVDKYGSEHGKTFDVKTYSCLSVFMSECENGFDIIFMDVKLPDGNGIDAIKKMRETNKDSIVIFVTDMAQFAVRGYEVRAMDYVVKPVSYYNFASKLEAAVSAYEMSRTAYIWIINKDGRTRLNAALIKYVEVFSHTLIYHTESGEYKEYGSIGLAQKKLEGLPFSPCSRFYLVNLAYVTNVSDSTATVGGCRLDISKRMRGQFLKDLNNDIARGGMLRSGDGEDGSL